MDGSAIVPGERDASDGFEQLYDRKDLLGVLERARDLGFLGPIDVVDHIDHARGFLPHLDRIGHQAGGFLDLGSGAGVPGLILALARPATSWLLVDSMVRRTTVLSEAVATLALSHRVTVWTGRAEELGRLEEHRTAHAVVVARSFGPPSAVAECAAPLLHVGGFLLVSEPPDYQSQGIERWPAAGIIELGLEMEGFEAGVTAMRKMADTPERYPRRTGIPARRHLF
jgi:16S rRNA (guanine527-N7)-methyltransferase